MPEEAPSLAAPEPEPATSFLPRPPAADRPLDLLGDRLRALRTDPRVGAALIALLAVAAGVFWYRSGTAPAASPSASSEGGATAGETVPVAGTTTTAPEASFIVVHVAGAVGNPGVVTLPAGSRVVDAVEAAGGPWADADLDRLNLAAPLADGERVAVARRGEPPPPLDAGAQGTAGDPGGTAESEPAFPLDLNAASAAELEALPGIGPTLAAAIVTERERRGGFTRIEDLQQVPGIGEQRFAQVRDLVTV